MEPMSPGVDEGRLGWMWGWGKVVVGVGAGEWDLGWGGFCSWPWVKVTIEVTFIEGLLTLG